MDVGNDGSGKVKDVLVWKDFVESEGMFVDALNFEIRKYNHLMDVLVGASMLLEDNGGDMEAVVRYKDLHEDISNGKLCLLMELEKEYSKDLEAGKKVLERFGHEL